MFLYDFDSCPYSVRNGHYGGQAGDKLGVLIDNEYWILKFPKSTRSMKGSNLPSYTTSPLSEYLGSHIFDILGFDVHETLLGVRDGTLVVACKDFRHYGEELVEIREVKNMRLEAASSLAEQELPESATGDSVNLEELLLHFKYNTLMQDVQLRRRFWETSLVDVLIDNNDRNNGNWGLLTNERQSFAKLAPVYDNGNSFLNKTADSVIAELVVECNVDKIVGTRTIYNYKGHILSSKKFLRLEFPDMQDALRRVVPLIGSKLQEISEFIDAIPETEAGYLICSKERKEYYKKCIHVRFDQLLLPAYLAVTQSAASATHTQLFSN